MASTMGKLIAMFRCLRASFGSRNCDILNYMVTHSDHRCTNDGGNFIFISQSINSRYVP